MEGRAIARPNSRSCERRSTPTAALQWRAGQLPGQTTSHTTAKNTTQRFNGGPGNCPAKHSVPDMVSCRQSLRFNGGPGNCPAKRGHRRATGSRWSGFNGGPGNCPAKPSESEEAIVLVTALQWRAGQLPGQTRLPGPDRGRRRRFNGGPGNCPAKPARRAIVATPISTLQWRAGQLPGQTVAGPAPTPERTGASMEGRAIARPNRSADLGLLTCLFAGVCERSRKLELRRCSDSVVKLRFALCRKAPSGPRDLCAHRSARIR